MPRLIRLIHGSRSADITDLITNTAGGLVGYGFYGLLSRLRNHFI